MQPITIGFIGGGTMAGAILGGLRAAGVAASSLHVVEPFEAQRQRLREQFGVEPIAEPDASLEAVDLLVWAVKPQQFAHAAGSLRERCPRAAELLQLSIMAGVRCAAISARSGAGRVVRSMPNTPALIGRGVTGLYASPACDATDRELAERVLGATGQLVWVDEEGQLDAVTAVSGSGPAYVFYVLEAMIASGVRLGLPEAAAKRLALGTIAGAAALAEASPLSAGKLREQVTSKGGTTAAALEVLNAREVAGAFDQALEAAARRAGELADALERDAS